MAETLPKPSGMPKLNKLPDFKNLILLSCLAILCLACSESGKSEKQKEESSGEFIKYAKAFQLENQDEIGVIKILNPENGEVIQFVSVGQDNSGNFDFNIKESPEKVVLLSTTYIAYVEALNELSSICGVSNPNLIYSSEMNKLIDENKIRDVGSDASLNMEVLIDLQPDLVLLYNYSASTFELSEKIKQFNIPVLFVNEFQELDPLGKSEWIKLFGMIYNKESLADSLFKNIEQEYNQLLSISSKFKDNPSVFTGLPWKGQWYQPGGKSFQAKFFSDAGANYLWSDDENIGGINIDREVVFEKALEADFWLHPSNSLLLSEISGQDERYTSFSSFKSGMVFNHTKRMNEDFGNDYWESAIMNPHIVLKDLICIFHPEVFPKRELVYYQKLN